jgi:uncharacterized protein
MLLKFSAENYLSLRDESEISFIAAPLKEGAEGLIPCEFTKHGVLPVIAIYGANASGKSNLLFALRFLRSAILQSFKESESDGIPYRPFLLDDDSRQKPSSFTVDFLMRGVRYQFGASFTSTRIAGEWLYRFPKRTKQLLYTRSADELNPFRFGRALMGSNRQIQSITRPNSLFISAATASGHPLLSEISNFFKDNLLLQLSSSIGPSELIAKQFEEDGELRTAAVKYLAIADTGIADLKIEHTPIPESILSELTQFQEALKKFIGKSNNINVADVEKVNTSIKFGHASSDGAIRFLDYSDESLGTRYLFTLLPPMLKALKTGSLLVLDEITTSLHTLLARRLVSLFNDKQLNPRGAQLIFSTHDTNLLAPGLLRRDEVWFAEKGNDGATIVYPLTDIRTKNTDNIERGYIQGRFGAIPFIREAVPDLQ